MSASAFGGQDGPDRGRGARGAWQPCRFAWVRRGHRHLPAGPGRLSLALAADSKGALAPEVQGSPASPGVQRGSTATGTDEGALGCTAQDGDLRRWTAVDGLPADGMQEVWGSNPHSSTSQLRALNSNRSWCEPLTPRLRARPRDPLSLNTIAQVRRVIGGWCGPRGDPFAGRQEAWFPRLQLCLLEGDYSNRSG